MLIVTCQFFQKGKAHKKGTKACSIRDKLKKWWQYSRYRRKPPSAADFFLPFIRIFDDNEQIFCL